ncbi:MAG: enoyl-CoA hydratase-related protein [Chloroflexota bacterium]
MTNISTEFPAQHPASHDRLARVALVTIERPEVLNALDAATMGALLEALRRLDGDEACRCIVLTGSGERAFAAGADIREMAQLSADAARTSGLFERWDEVAALGTPIIAAVRGFALGGGCELAMACDIIVASEDAQFAQPEVGLGIMPGVGGTQRLTRAVGKSKAMAMILSGRRLSATEAVTLGLVAEVVPAGETVTAALDLAVEIAAQAPLAVRAAKAAVKRAHESALSVGIEQERAVFIDLFDSDDQAEGMAAFVEKRRPRWKGR